MTFRELNHPYGAQLDSSALAAAVERALEPYRRVDCEATLANLSATELQFVIGWNVRAGDEVIISCNPLVR